MKRKYVNLGFVEWEIGIPENRRELWQNVSHPSWFTILWFVIAIGLLIYGLVK